MKVAPGTNSELNLNKKVDKQSSRNEIDSNSGGEFATEGFSEKADFASVLDRVTKSTERTHERSNQPHSSDSNKATARKSPHDDDDTQTVGPGRQSGVENASAVTADSSVETTSILHLTDLEKIVDVCRVQVAPGGQTEVVLDLSHSILDGLRVKVRTDGAGRIATEFLAANEGIKSLLDSRSAELIAMLRSRGINLTEFKSSVTADSNSGSDKQERHLPKQDSGTDRSVRAVSSRDDPESSQNSAIGTTYRA
jgi:flagellar hook-length control protein FliK